MIGTQANGTDALGNGLEGVQIFSPNNTIGGIDRDPTDTNSPANLIAFNGGDGLQVTGGVDNPFAVGNRILSNSIFSNGDLGIDLDGGIGFSNPDADGVTANDEQDLDTGPNTLQNFPRLISTATASGTTTIKGVLKSSPEKSFTIQFFSSQFKDPSGRGEGKTFLGQTKVATNQLGNASFTFSKMLRSGENVVSATATNRATGDTSEFSNAVTAS